MIDLRSAVLVIDDGFDPGDGLADRLRKIGFANIMQDDGRRAMLLLRTHSFALVLANELTLRRSGLESMPLIMKKRPELAGTRHITITALGDGAYVRTPTEAGIGAFIVKPFTLEALRGVVMKMQPSASPATSAANDPAATAAPGEPRSRPAALDADIRPMLPMYENGVDLHWHYGNLKPPTDSRVAPWQVALQEWWQFVRRREILVAERRTGAGDGGKDRSI